MGLYLRGVAPFPSPSALNTLRATLYHEDFDRGPRGRALPRCYTLNDVLVYSCSGHTLTEKQGSRSFLHRQHPNGKTRFLFILAQATEK